MTAFVRKQLRLSEKEEKPEPEREPLLGGQTKVCNDEEADPSAADASSEEGAPKLKDVLTGQTTLNLGVYTLLALYTIAYDQVSGARCILCSPTKIRAASSSVLAPSSHDTQ